MTYWIAKYSLTAIAAAGSLLGCHYCTALLTTILSVSITNHVGELRARRHTTNNRLTTHCGSTP